MGRAWVALAAEGASEDPGVQAGKEAFMVAMVDQVGNRVLAGREEIREDLASHHHRLRATNQ